MHELGCDAAVEWSLLGGARFTWRAVRDGGLWRSEAER